MNCKNCGEPNTTPNFRNCERCRKKWREAQRSPTSNKLEKMQSKLATQRNEIAMLTRKLETATKKKTALLNELKWMRGENTENRYFRQKYSTSASGDEGGEHPILAEVKGGNPENWRK